MLLMLVKSAKTDNDHIIAVGYSCRNNW